MLHSGQLTLTMKTSCQSVSIDSEQTYLTAFNAIDYWTVIVVVTNQSSLGLAMSAHEMIIS
jgi:hypothetical protein